MQVDAKFVIPMAQISGNMKSRMRSGDKVRLLASTGWEEFYILEIIGRALYHIRRLTMAEEITLQTDTKIEEEAFSNSFL